MTTRFMSSRRYGSAIYQSDWGPASIQRIRFPADARNPLSYDGSDPARRSHRVQEQRLHAEAATTCLCDSRRSAKIGSPVEGKQGIFTWAGASQVCLKETQNSR